MSGSVHLQMVNNVYLNFLLFEQFFISQKSKSFDWSDSISLIIMISAN